MAVLPQVPDYAGRITTPAPLKDFLGLRAQQMAGQKQEQAIDLQQAEIDRFTQETNLRSMVGGAQDFLALKRGQTPEADEEIQNQFLRQRVSEIQTRGGDPRDTLETLAMTPEQRTQVAQNIMEIGQQQGILEQPAVAKQAKMRAVVDVTPDEFGAPGTRQTFVTDPQIAASPERYQPIKREPLVRVNMGGDEGLEGFPSYTPTILDGKSLGTPTPITNKIQYEARVQEAKALAKTTEKRSKSTGVLAGARNMWRDILKRQVNYTKKSIGGTGPFVTLWGLTKYASQNTELLDTSYARLEMEKVKELAEAAGARSIDSDSERRALRATIGSITKDDKTNIRLLMGGAALAERGMKYQKEQKRYIAKNNTLNGFVSDAYETVAIYNPDALLDQKTLFVDRKDVDKYLSLGFVGIDAYSDLLATERKYSRSELKDLKARNDDREMFLWAINNPNTQRARDTNRILGIQ